MLPTHNKRLSPTNKTHLWMMVALLLLGTLLLVRGMNTSQRLHADEAYFLTFARQAAVTGDWMLGGALDKPPLVIYAHAFSMSALAINMDSNNVLHLDIYRGEFAGRLVGAYSALLALALFNALLNTYVDDKSDRLIGSVLFMTSPFWVAWGASAFLDMPMLALSLASWVRLRQSKSLQAGVLWGLAFCAKPQALFLVPLIIVDAYAHKQWIRFAIGATSILIILLVWDTMRPETGIFTLGAANNIAQDAFWSNPITGMSDWWQWLRWLGGWEWITGGLILLAVAGIFLKNQTARSTVATPRWMPWIWGTWAIAYSILHISTRLNIYDRYVLLLLPVLVLLLIRWLPWWKIRGVMLFAIAIMSWSSWQIHSLPIGSDKGANKDIVALADYLNSLPVARVVYDRWLGWQLGYYMGEWTNKRRVYYPTPTTLVRGALALREDGARYFVAPDDAPYQVYLLALEHAGFNIAKVRQFGHFGVYCVLPP